MNSFRFGVFAQLISSYVLAVIFIVAAAGVGIFSIQNFYKGIEEVALSRLPAMTLAYQLGQQSEAIVASAPMLVRAESQAEREVVTFRIADRVRWLQEIIDNLRHYDVDANILEVIDNTRLQLLENYAGLDHLVEERIRVNESQKNQNSALLEMMKSKDGFLGLYGKPWGEAFYQVIETLFSFETGIDQGDLNQYEQILNAHFDQIKTYQKNITGPEDKALIVKLRSLALGESGLVALHLRKEEIGQKISDILAINDRLSSRFVFSINDLIRRMHEEIQSNSINFQESVETSTKMLSILVVSCVVMISLIGWFFIRRILKRLNVLKRSMRIHAEGGKADIPLHGKDEISDMGEALKYFVDEINHREAELRISEARFRDVAEATSDWFWETDKNSKFILVSDRFFEITGYMRADVIGFNRFEFGGRNAEELDDPEKWILHKNDMSNRRRFRDFFYSLKCPDGLWRHIKVSGKPVFKEDGDFVGYRGTGSDVTAEVQARSRLMAANEIMPGAFALWDHENRLVLCNRKYHQYYKVLIDRIRPGVTFEELVLLLEERNGIRDGFGYAERRRRFRQKPTGIFMEALSNGRYLQVSEATTLDGGTVSLVIDITDRIEAETRLERARAEAENANKAKSRFLASASHDLRQPLHAIGMFLSALEDRRRKDVGEIAEGDLRIIENISDSLEALRGLLNALLDISKLDAGVMKADFKSVMLRPLVDRLLKQYEGRANEKGLHLKSFCPNVAVRSDPVLLERVLSNLLSNAVRYTFDGGVFLGVRRRGDKVLVQVYDTGVGIPNDKFSDIFIEFNQLDNPARDRRRGLGLGLAIVERVLMLLDHPLNLRSVVGKGSCFSLELPSEALPQNTIELKPIEVALLGAGVPLIVVIDDEPDILEGMEQLILGWKYDVIAAHSTQDALNQLEKTDVRPSLILADYRLQEEMTGADCIRAIQEKLNFPVPAAIITGDTAPERIQDAKASGFILLHKPLRPAKLRQLIRSVQVQSIL